MSNKYRHRDIVPDNVIANRLAELACFVAKGVENHIGEFTMSIPAERDRDADLVMSAAAIRLRGIAELEGLLREAENPPHGYLPRDLRAKIRKALEVNEDD